MQDNFSAYTDLYSLKKKKNMMHVSVNISLTLFSTYGGLAGARPPLFFIQKHLPKIVVEDSHQY